mmetsp:Transcript_3477/g.7542  ORF Transcript_3477/g.7542 Transcript_3477/m.7542 type:complete len:305 (+) Transcript_3477:101-1015(+)
MWLRQKRGAFLEREPCKSRLRSPLTPSKTPNAPRLSQCLPKTSDCLIFSRERNKIGSSTRMAGRLTSHSTLNSPRSARSLSARFNYTSRVSPPQPPSLNHVLPLPPHILSPFTRQLSHHHPRRSHLSFRSNQRRLLHHSATVAFSHSYTRRLYHSSTNNNSRFRSILMRRATFFVYSSARNPTHRRAGRPRGRPSALNFQTHVISRLFSSQASLQTTTHRTLHAPNNGSRHSASPSRPSRSTPSKASPSIPPPSLTSSNHSPPRTNTKTTTTLLHAASCSSRTQKAAVISSTRSYAQPSFGVCI